ncbi:DNA polymerase III subunit gamma/tau [Thalassotalea agariperforans]
MSYQVLARKWRPKKFQELMGQDHVVSVLVNALAQQRLHHAYLFTGTRGVGKTTIARIFAKSLNCQQGISSEPCGTCDTCVDIDQGRFVDLLEIDAASRTKVDDTREILDNVQYAPSRGRYKVYLIDEVHMLSRSSFNALLKTLEEPPEHVKFILATTDPQKLPVTVLSRCLQFHLKALTVAQIKQQLVQILSAEQVEVDQGSLSLLAKAARGSMRDGLSLTDQAIAQGQGSINFANVQQMLGGIDQHWPYKILIALIKQDHQALMTLSLEIASYSPSYSRLLAELIQLLHQVAMAQVIECQFDLAPEHEKLLAKFCQAMSPEDVQLYYQIALNGRKDLPYAIDEQAAFDMTLLRLAAFKPATQHNVVEHSEVKAPEVDFTDIALADSDVTQAALHHNPVTELTPQASTQSTQQQPAAAEEPSIDAQVINNEEDPTNQFLAEPQPSLSEPNEAMLFQQQQQIEQSAIEQGFQNHSFNNDMAQQVPDFPATENTNNVDNFANTVNTNAEPVNQASAAPIAEQVEQQPLANPATENVGNLDSPVAAILASRNMLRSKKKQLEPKEKKFDGAAERQKTPAVTLPKKDENLPEFTDIPEQEFTPEVIDPATIRSANQVDKWANMIDHMALNGRLRQLAIHATIGQGSNDNHLVLQLNQSTKHLQSEAAHSQLEQALSNLLQRNITVEIVVVEETVADPYQIQSEIDDKRYEYAKTLLKEDKVVQHLQNHFQATMDESSIVAR